MKCKNGGKGYPGAILSRQERTYNLCDLSRLIPGSPTYETMRLWCVEGRLKDRADINSQRVKLEHIILSNGRASSMEAYWRFVEELNR